jgi:hypothetical protein
MENDFEFAMMTVTLVSASQIFGVSRDDFQIQIFDTFDTQMFQIVTFFSSEIGYKNTN